MAGLAGQFPGYLLDWELGSQDVRGKSEEKTCLHDPLEVWAEGGGRSEAKRKGGLGRWSVIKQEIRLGD